MLMLSSQGLVWIGLVDWLKVAWTIQSAVRCFVVVRMIREVNGAPVGLNLCSKKQELDQFCVGTGELILNRDLFHQAETVCAELLLSNEMLTRSGTAANEGQTDWSLLALSRSAS